MLIELYLLLVVVTLLSFIYGLAKNQRTLSIITLMFMFALAYASMGVEKTFCEVDCNNVWTCHSEIYKEPSLTAVWFGLAMLYLYQIFTMYTSDALKEDRDLWPKI